MFDATFISSSIRLTIPILLAAVGCCYMVKVNILNLSLEGMILVSAFFATWGTILTANPWVGLVFGMLSSLTLSAIFGLLIINLRANALIVGIAMNLAAVGLSTVLLELIFGVRGLLMSPRIISFPVIRLPFLDQIPIFRPIVGEFDPIVYLTIVLVILLTVVMYRTPLGMRIRAIGEHPEAAETAGINLRLHKHAACLICGLMCGIAGTYLPLGGLSIFTENMSAGKGFIALAAALFGMGSPVIAVFASLLFGFATALAMRLQGMGLPSHFVLMTPYVLTLVLLIARRFREIIQSRFADRKQEININQ